jgi:CBS domain-containing protein
MPHVADILRGRELYSVESTQSVAEVAEWMAELNVGAIVVLDRDELCGVFSERDLLKRVVVSRRDPEQVRVGAVMTQDPITIRSSAMVEEAMELMREHNIRHLPVMEDDHVVGFLSMRDLMHFDLERKTEEVFQMRAYITQAT